ncbi:MAG TPA: hypothetical protein ENJ27_02280 [Candidatus Moranbacteria bacterium]|nr:hypothetical protein [Candidatus Moranbacteria bacterium]
MNNFKDLVNFCFSDMVLINKKIDDIYDMENLTNNQVKDEVYQLFAVELSTDEDSIVSTLNQYGQVLVYDNNLDCYFFPVFHYGTPWESVSINNQAKI